MDIIIGKTLVVYLSIILGLRLFGKKELSQLSITDLVFILLLSNSVQNAMVGTDGTLLGGLVAAGTLFITNYIFKWILYKSKRLSKLLQGDPVMLIYKGRILAKNLDSLKMTKDELNISMREHGYISADEIEIATMETDGNISYIAKKVLSN
jgi:uncharacterized membrane protein YcaP (DUF421 family)